MFNRYTKPKSICNCRVTSVAYRVDSISDGRGDERKEEEEEEEEEEEGSFFTRKITCEGS